MKTNLKNYNLTEIAEIPFEAVDVCDWEQDTKWFFVSKHNDTLFLTIAEESWNGCEYRPMPSKNYLLTNKI